MASSPKMSGRSAEGANRRFLGIVLLLTFVLLQGCAHVISKNLRDAADRAATFQRVFENPNAYKGKTVIWGGEIIETVNQKEGNTLIEVFQRPLDWRGEPRMTVSSEGRFMVLVESYLDPYRFRQGRRVTVGGEILGERRKRVGEMDYPHPLVLAKQVYLWDEYYYVNAPYPYLYDPWWGYPYGWGYPYYWWRFGFYYYR